MGTIGKALSAPRRRSASSSEGESGESFGVRGLVLTSSGSSGGDMGGNGEGVKSSGSGKIGEYLGDSGDNGTCLGEMGATKAS